MTNDKQTPAAAAAPTPAAAGAPTAQSEPASPQRKPAPARPVATWGERLLSHTLSLLVVFLLLTATAVWTGSLFGHPLTGDAADGASDVAQSASVSLPNAEQKAALGLDDAALLWTARDSISWAVTTAQGDTLGLVVSSAPFAHDVLGYAGPTPIYIRARVNGTIVAVAAADNAETPNFFSRAWDGVASAYVGHSLSEAAQLQVDAVSGATFSSRAIMANMQRASAAAIAQDTAADAAPTIGWVRTAIVAVVLLFGLIVSVRFKHSKPLRIVVLLLNIGVLGFWCGQFLSVTLLRGWLANGLDPVAYLPTLLVLAVALVPTFFRHKHHYCSWVCPYGSLQEIAALIPGLRIEVSPKGYAVLRHVRFGALALLLFLLWMGLATAVLDYEPFSGFLLSVAEPAVIALAAAFVVLSIFVPRLWCKALCPMGSFLDLAEHDAK